MATFITMQETRPNASHPLSALANTGYLGNSDPSSSFCALLDRAHGFAEFVIGSESEVDEVLIDFPRSRKFDLTVVTDAHVGIAKNRLEPLPDPEFVNWDYSFADND